MLSLNSYGCASRPAPSNNNHQRHVVLPRLSLHGSGTSSGCGGGLVPTSPARSTNSLTKLEMMRANTHPLYRTTAGFDYGRCLDFKDVALSCPKHAKPATFTKEFIAGTFSDSSLGSIDRTKQRHASWQLKVAARTKEMQIKHVALQHELEVKKDTRRVVRDQRRRERAKMHCAATIIQALVRGSQVRSRLERETLQRHTTAALKIQQVCRSHVQVRQAQQLLLTLKRQVLDVFAVKIQRHLRDYTLRIAAKRELARRRKQKQRELDDLKRRVRELQDDAARDIQRALRTHVARRKQQCESSATSSRGSGKDSGFVHVRGSSSSSSSSSSRSRIARKTLATLKRPKHDKSTQRLSV